MAARAQPAWLTTRPIAHRGLHGPDRPENSLPAFEAARDAGHPIELDVHVLRDGTVAVFHDHDLARACGVPGRLVDETAASLGARRLFGTTHGIPRLDEVLALVAGRVPVLVEVKRGPQPGAERAIAAVLAGYRGELAVQSFNPYSVRWFRRHVPALCAGQLGGRLRGAPLPTFERFASRRLLGVLLSRPHFLNYELSALPDAWVARVRGWLDVPLLCWTVRSRTDRDRADALGLNYVFDPLPRERP